jgi:triosephosphate isomerase
MMAVLLSVYSYRNSPIVDFRPYTVGTHIADKMIVPAGMPLNEYETLLVYEKDGVSKEFTPANYPWKDTTWKWVETKQKLVKKGYEPLIHDFMIISPDGADITGNILTDTAYTFLIISHDLKKPKQKAFQIINEYAVKGMAKGFRFFMLTSSPDLQC